MIARFNEKCHKLGLPLSLTCHKLGEAPWSSDPTLAHNLGEGDSDLSFDSQDQRATQVETVACCEGAHSEGMLGHIIFACGCVQK